MNNNPNNYKFDPNTGEPLFNNNNNNSLPDNNFSSSSVIPPEPQIENNVIPTPTVESSINNPIPTPTVESSINNPIPTPTVESSINNPIPTPTVDNRVNNTNLTNGQTGYIPPIAPTNGLNNNGYIPNSQYNFNKPNNEKKKSGSKIAVVLFYIFILAIIAAVVLAFVFPKKKNAEPKDVTRTIMIYMVGSDLESKAGYGTAELNSIKYNKIDNENINVVVIAGGAKNWHNDYIDTDETSIFELTDDGYKKVKKQSIKNMGDSKTLSSFLDYVYENYKSDKYDLIFWDHGAAIAGAEVDELQNNDFLTLAEMSKALSNSPFDSNNKMELVIFSTCLNGTIEVANTFKDYADYLVASEEVTMSVPTGNDFEFIKNVETSDKAYDVALKFVDGYKSKMNDYYKIANYNSTKAYSTYSIIDLSNVSELVDAVNDFFDDIDVSDNYNEIARVRANIYQYPSVDTTYDMVDLYNLVDGLKELSPNKANKVIELLETTISYNWATNSKSRGLSIYFPYKTSREYANAYQNIYSGFRGFNNYNDFITKFYSIKTSGKSTNRSYEENKTTVDYKDGEADFTLELTNDQLETFASGYYYVFRKNEDGTYKPIYMNGQTDLKGNKLTAKIKGKQLVVKSDGECPEGRTCVDDYPLILDELDVDNDYIRYTTNVLLEDFSTMDWVMDRARITLVYNTKTGKIDIADVNPINDNESDNTPTRTSLNIKDYKTIAFSASSSYTITDTEMKSNGVITGVETPTDDFYFAISNFDDGYEYYCIFVIEDTYGNLSRSKLIKMD